MYNDTTPGGKRHIQIFRTATKCSAREAHPLEQEGYYLRTIANYASTLG